MSDEALKKLEEIQQSVNVILTYIPQIDVVTNEKYCELRSASGSKLTIRGLREWFKKGCPRKDSRHVSVSDVNKWAEGRNTRQAKSK